TLGQISVVQNLPALVTGFAISESGFGLVSVKNRNRIYLGDFEGNLLNSYLLLLNGEPFMKGNGDMASGCDGSFQGGECPDFLTYYTGYPQNNADNELYGISLGEDNSVELTLIEGFSTEDNHIALNPEGLIYAVREDKIDIFDPSAGAYVQENIPIQTPSGQSLNGFPAATFDLNGVLFLGRPSDNTVYSIDFVGGVAEATVAFSGLSISGGDLIATGTSDDQVLWLVNRTQSTLTNLLDNSVVDLELNEVNGACLLEDGRLLLANGSTSEAGGLYAVDLSDFSTQMLSLTGGPEVFFNGDLASGCPSSVAALTEFASTDSNFERNLSIMPNPSRGMTTVVFTALENERVTIEILDMSGRVVETLLNRNSQNAGEQRVIFDGSRLTNGIYLVRMTSNDFQRVERLVVSR
ncbi:MAG TPA: T9SS type A sorting domain-containing protein, partial [Cryomorphaceae bacterium]|nr:T9SS type A sorting domain-containing protein [Cryomorphaceae bacterium]